ncbi:DoxX family protein [Sphingobium sp. PNB]|uniref:DoxX family protein n=1 Tax=Sphingobium sp. PNB TaxID=863934 RepID=UPI001D028A86|nr:DoxX family protein [Sphingobium sp. PNB]MCB4858453.1 DoxX family protein [Sphingobium sp. PNB]
MMPNNVKPPVRGAQLGRYAGYLLSAVVMLILVADGLVDLFAPQLIQAQMTETGFPASLAMPLGCIILLCAALYVVPATAVVGAIFITGFAGGAICAHFRIAEIGSPPELFSLMLGALPWGGLYLRHDRLRPLLPLRSSDSS